MDASDIAGSGWADCAGALSLVPLGERVVRGSRPARPLDRELVETMRRVGVLPAMAPAYDLVCTSAWDQLAKTLALSVAGVKDAGAVGAPAWTRFARDASLAPRVALDVATATATAVREHAPRVAERVIDAGADAAAVRVALAQVGAHAARALRLLEIQRGSVFARVGALNER